MSALAHVESEPIPGYKLKKRIGAGGYGEVWRAEAPGQLMKALKFVFGYLDEDRACRELKALTRIRDVRHPFLLSLERIEVVQGQLVIVTELADGSLKDRYEECKRLGGVGIPREELLVYMRDAADALDYMSEHHSLQHLDVKPENLLLVGQRIKVADFGLVKDLHDVSVSMMGGLTPLYAPPELFDGTPCRFSDQYSLAIVYMEMLTGVLPFPGTTAAQLATQHMNGRPRLTSLSPGDQVAIARALLKDPKQRFESCRALVESLRQAGPPSDWRAREGVCGTTTIATTGNGDSPGPSGPSRDRAQAWALGTASHDGIDRTAPTKAPSGERPILTTQNHEPGVKPLVPIRPIGLDPNGKSYRPTLFVGIGGTGALVLTRLHRRLLDHFGDEQALAALPLLLLDVDGKTLHDAAFGNHAAAGAFQTLALPLRKPQDYRSDAKLFTKATSRRWLYNIPRSLQTDGMRPLGRLALADHAPQVCEQVRASIAQMLSPEALAATGKALGWELSAAVPRVVLVASISGGAGSGTVLETAYAVRKVLCELGLPQELCGLLLHSTPRSQAGRDLAVANALACLGELRQFSAADHGYPGDADCGLPAFAPGVPTFDDAYLLHLGDQLGAEEFERAARKVAEYVFLDAVTPAGGRLRELRRGEPTDASREPGFSLRSFGLCQIGGGDEDFSKAATEVLCRQVVEAWLGPEPGARREASEIGDIERMADARRKDLKIDFDQLTVEIQEVFKNEHKRGQSAALNKALTDKLAELADARATSLSQWLLGLVNQPGVRVRGGHAAAAWFIAQLRQFDEHARGMLENAERERSDIETVLAAAASPVKTRGRAALGPAELAQKREREAQLGEAIVSLRGMRQVLHAICAKTVSAAERLRDLVRDVQFHATQFQAPALWDEPAPPDDAERGLADEVRASARQSLRVQLAELAQSLDSDLHAEYLAPQGGLLALFHTPHQRTALTAALRESARLAVKKSLRSVDVAAAMIPTNKPRDWAVTQLRECVAVAQPDLAFLGGKRQLLILVPPGANSGRLRDFIQAELGEHPDILPVSASGATFLVECEGISPRQAIETLSDDRPDYVEAASRLHSRSDISWQPLGSMIAGGNL